MPHVTCECEECARRARRKFLNEAVRHELGLLWQCGQDTGAATVLVGQIDDVEILRELIVMLQSSRYCLWEEVRDLREEVET